MAGVVPKLTASHDSRRDLLQFAVLTANAVVAPYMGESVLRTTQRCAWGWGVALVSWLRKLHLPALYRGRRSPVLRSAYSAALPLNPAHACNVEGCWATSWARSYSSGWPCTNRDGWC
jgi:hypothetical protein